jgi:glycosyltransferase involved in cell wall biosynthesis
MAARGHEVELLAGWDGIARIDAPGVRVRLFRARKIVPSGFSGLVAPGLLAYMRANHRDYDVVHFQLCRDLVTLPVAAFLSLQKTNYVVQPHGMIRPDRRLRARIFDLLAVRRVLARAASVIAYRGVDDEDLRIVSQDRASIRFLENGVTQDFAPVDYGLRGSDVLFMARLHPRKRVLAFADMARILRERGIKARFSVVGPDEGDLESLRRFVEVNKLEEHVTYEGALPYAQVRERLRRSSVYILPSVDEPFPVTVLEAMAVGTPCVITGSCGLAPYFRDHTAGMVTDGSSDDMADAVERLLADSKLRESTVDNARRTIDEHFSISAVARTLESYYRAE